MVNRFCVGHAGHADWRAAVRDCVAQLGPLSAGGGLALTYMSDGFAEHCPDILDMLEAETGIDHWCGATAPGIIANDREYFDEPALALLVGELPGHTYRGFSSESAHQAGAMAIIHGDSRRPEIHQLVGDLGRGPLGFLIGGLTTSEGRRLVDGQVDHSPYSGVAFAAADGIATGVSQGCTPIGPMHEVTECDRHIAITLDDRPALDVMREEIGEVLSRQLHKLGGYIFVALPVAGSDTGDYLVRNLVGFDTEANLVAVGAELTRGDRLMFCKRDQQAAEDDLKSMVRGAKARLPGPVRGALYVSCLARGPNLFGAGSHEVAMVQNELKDAEDGDAPVPLIGFFANGEISNDRLYTYTGVLTLFS